MRGRVRLDGAPIPQAWSEKLTDHESNHSEVLTVGTQSKDDGEKK
jgi:hypothetical protein